MKFFKELMRVLAAAGAVAVVDVFAPALMRFFQGANPSDLSPIVWGLVSTAAVFALNYLLSKIPNRQAP